MTVTMTRDVDETITSLIDAELAIELEEDQRYLCAERRRIARETTSDALRDRRIAQLVSDAAVGGRRYTTEDVLGWLDYARSMSYEPLIGQDQLLALRNLVDVPNAPLREAFLKSPVPAARLGAILGYGQNQSVAVERLLGIRAGSDSPRTGRPTSVRLFIPYETAVKIADALDMNYHEAGV